MGNKGQSLIEVIVTAAVGILVVTALTFTTLYSLRNSNFAKTSAQATKLSQEGIERVRTGRDRIGAISGDFRLSGQPVTSWDDPDLWFYPINTNCIPNCYFNVNASGLLQYLTAASSIPSSAETTGQFQRIIILSDDAEYANQKIVTVIVTWTDTTGPHESKLTTILRKL